MGSPPPPDGTPPVVSVDKQLPLAPDATICGFAIGIPKIKFSINLPAIKIPSLPTDFLKKFAFPSLSCDLKSPPKLDGGLKSGGGRKSNAPKDPDDNEAT